MTELQSDVAGGQPQPWSSPDDGIQSPGGPGADDKATHIVRAGQYLDQIAHAWGWKPTDLWEHPCNSALREKRDDPNLLAPGDVVHVPIQRRKPLSVNIGAENAFMGVVPTVCVRVRLLGDDGKPMAAEEFLLEGTETPPDAKTTGEGVAEFHPSIFAREVEIVLPKRQMRLAVRIGSLDPPSEPSGMRQRLANLGYCVPEAVDEETTDAAVGEALRRFLDDKKKDASSEEDEALKTLVESHGR